ncbi:hypothetical protein [Nocardioides marinquilinus]|uniref:hypothetical protein n=1 Tax=Nocardioides marinquilinus TaxID=1210400 RepID=UPI0031F0D7FB
MAPTVAVERPRDLGVDVARGVAVFSMFIAHFAPSAGPGDVLILSEYLTAPLFALLIGWGAQLGHGRDREVWSIAVRATVLVLLGLALEQLETQIVIVLVWLGVLTVLCGLLVRTPTAAVLAVGAVSFALTPTLLDRSRDWLQERAVAGDPVTGLPLRLVELTVGGPDYRLTGLLPAACVGIVLARHPGRLVRFGTLAVAAAGAVVLLGADASGRIDLVPYSGTHLTMLFELALVMMAAQLSRTLAPALGGFGRLLGAVGGMTLSIYVAQVLVDAWYLVDRPPGFRDDSWLLIIGQCAGAVALAVTWPRAIHRNPWSKGPLEGLERLFVRSRRLLDRRSP